MMISPCTALFIAKSENGDKSPGSGLQAPGRIRKVGQDQRGSDCRAAEPVTVAKLLADRNITTDGNRVP
jgi:hypothetical protein